MRRLLAILAVLVLGASIAAPAFAGHRDRYRGHGRHSHPHLRGRVCRIVHAAPRPRAGLHFGFGFPVVGGVYVGPTATGPISILVPAPVWVPGHYAYDDDVRIFVQGHWSR